MIFGNFKIVHPVVCFNIKREINKFASKTTAFCKISICEGHPNSEENLAIKKNK